MTQRWGYAIVRVVSALVVFALLTFYVWCAQRVYDRAGEGFTRIALYALLILGAGLSYDCGKAILLMPRPKLNETVLMPMALIGVMVITGAATVFFALRGWPVSSMLVLLALARIKLENARGLADAATASAGVPFTPLGVTP